MTNGVILRIILREGSESLLPGRGDDLPRGRGMHCNNGIRETECIPGHRTIIDTYDQKKRRPLLGIC